jgi:hypothetical protein
LPVKELKRRFCRNEPVSNFFACFQRGLS